MTLPAIDVRHDQADDTASFVWWSLTDGRRNTDVDKMSTDHKTDANEFLQTDV